MEEVLESELTPYLQHHFLKAKIEIMVKGVKDAGLEKEFLEFMESNEIDDIADAEEIFLRFAKKHPNKFYIVPESERIDKTFYCSLNRGVNDAKSIK